MAEEAAKLLTLMRANVDSFNNQIAKMKGIPAARVNTDMNTKDIIALCQSVKIILAEKTKKELISFIKFKLEKGPYCTNYQSAYKRLFGEALYQKLLANKLQEPEKITIYTKYIERLMKNRPIIFYGATDTAVCFGGKRINDPNYFVTMSNNPDLINYISYPELEFSRRLAFSCLSYLYRFTGDKHELVSSQPILVHAYAGLRFERPETPEYKRLISNEKSKKEAEFIVINESSNLFLNKTVYKTLAKEVYENYLADANQRAQAVNKRAYVRILTADLVEPYEDIMSEVQFETLKEILNEANFNAKYANIEKIEISHPRWKQKKKAIKNNIVVMKEGSNEDTSAHFSDPMEGMSEKGSTESLLLCVNSAMSANAYVGNRIYGNYLSSFDAGLANCTNITAILNPSINPFLSKEKLLEYIAVRFNDGNLISLSAAKEYQAKSMPAPTETLVSPTTNVDADITVSTSKEKISGALALIKKIFLAIFAHAKIIFLESYHKIQERLKKKSPPSS